MVLRIQKKANNRIFKVYLLAMLALMVVRYILKVDVPAAAFLLVAMLPIWFGSTSEQLAFAMSCIPLSVAFQYKYALLTLSVAILLKNRWRLKRSGAFIVVMAMMAWELWHAFYGRFSYTEYLRDFAELVLLGIVTSIDLKDVDHKLVIRSLSVSVVGVCGIMLLMQMQQFDFDQVAVFASHQIEQFLYYCGVKDAQVVHSQIANYAHPDYPELDDYGHAVLLGDNGATQYFRVDWFTPDGLSNWGDGRIFIQGTEGYIEIRKYLNVGNNDGVGNHVYLVDSAGEHYFDVNGKVGYPFFGQLILDCINRTENAMTQEHAFKAAELCVKAQMQAQKIV